MYYIGIDLGGTTIKGGIVTEDGKIIKSKSVPTLPEREDSQIVKSMAMLALELINEEGIDIKDVHSIGIGAPGLIDSKNKVIVASSNINFNNTNIGQEMKKHLDLPVYLENDANCATIAEFVCGSMKGYDSGVMFTIGTGVGGGVILNGKMSKGSYLGEGELGHIIVDYTGGTYCGCGQKGCLETFCSANAMIKYAKQILENEKNSKILELADSFEEINAKNIFDAYDLKDDVATKVVERFNTYLAIGIVNIVNIFRPGVISIGGGASARGELLTKPIEEIAQKMIYGNGFETKIVPATLGNDAGIIGAAMISKA
ncbi:ROK family protein [uncultured Tyzzerella sp.]|uniref:ROK family protein n=1 Tax=uncultured Tyzzerella sp. TaxID=2321398 RepID=UPI0029433E0F|nr:ROK family protein [uncultured Tyzzerella sp.]